MVRVKYSEKKLKTVKSKHRQIYIKIYGKKRGNHDGK
jgi:hypothetical protein